MGKAQTEDQKIEQAARLLEKAGYTVCPTYIANLIRDAPLAQVGTIASDVVWTSAALLRTVNNIIFCAERIIQAIDAGKTINRESGEARILRVALGARNQLRREAPEDEAAK